MAEALEEDSRSEWVRARAEKEERLRQRMVGLGRACA